MGNNFSDLTPENTIDDPITGISANVITEEGNNKLLVKTFSAPVAISDYFFQKAENGGSSSLTVNGSTTPVTFTINADSSEDIFLQELRFTGDDGGIQIDNFMGLNSPLSNGINVVVTSSGNTFEFFPIKATSDFQAHFSWGNGKDFNSYAGSGNDFVTASFSPLNPIRLVAGTADKAEVTINDNLTQVDNLEFIAFGYKQ